MGRRTTVYFFGLLLFGFAGTLPGDPLQYYNIYSNTERVRIVNPEYQTEAVDESDEQYRILSGFDNDFDFRGSSFFVASNSSARRVASRGSLTQIYSNMPSVTRLTLAFSRRGLNATTLVFRKPLEVPLWAESIEFWGHGHGLRHGYRLVYRDESGQNYQLDFGMTSHYGWRRFAAALPMRQDESRPFSVRYRRLWITGLVIMDDHAREGRPTLYHLANLAASRIRRTLDNQKEFWKFRRLHMFENMSTVKTRLFGYTNEKIGLLAGDHGAGQHQALTLRAEWTQEGLHKTIVRFRTPLHADICRKIVLNVRGQSRHERIHVLVRNVLREYFLLSAGEIDFSGWQKISLTVPYWIVQQTRNIAEKRGLDILEILVEPGPAVYARDGLDLAFGTIGAVEDSGTFLAPALDILERW